MQCMLNLLRIALTTVVWYSLLSATAHSDSKEAVQSGKNSFVKVSLESVAGTVSYSPNLPSGGYAPSNQRLRYANTAISLVRSIGMNNQAFLNYSNHQLTTRRDLVDVHMFSADFKRKLNIRATYGVATIGAGLTYGFSNQIVKNSYTHLDKGIITSATIDRPESIDFRLVFGFSRFLTPAIWMTNSFNFGWQKTHFQSITGVGKTNPGCAVKFALQQSGGVLEQREPCGQVQAFKQVFPDNNALLDSIGFIPSKEIQFESVYLRHHFALSASLNEKSTLSTSYSFALTARDDIDDNSFGYEHTPINHSHTLGLDINYRATQKLNAHMGIAYRVAPLLTEVPILYTRYTAHRFQDQSVSFSVSVQYHLN